MPAQPTYLGLYETKTIVNLAAFTGALDNLLYVSAGSRAVITLLVTAIDPATTVAVSVDNTFDISEMFETLDTFQLSMVGRIKRAVTDFHTIFNFKVLVTGGNATFKVGITLTDNASGLSEVDLVRNEILNASDLDEDITWAGNGRQERVTQIAYMAPSVSFQTLLKTFTYVPIGCGYRLTNVTWSLI